MKKIISISNSKNFSLVNRIDDSKKQNFKNRVIVSIFVVLYYLLVLVVTLLSDDVYKDYSSFDWIQNKTLETLKPYFAILLMLIIFVPFVFCLVEASYLIFRKYERIPIFLVVFFCTIAYLLPLCYFIASRLFININENVGDYYLRGSYIAILFGFASLLILLVSINIILSIYKRNNFKNVITLNTLAIIITLGFSGFVFMAIFKGWLAILFLLLSVVITDVMCYISGMLFGKHKMAKFISPNKTWEGAIIGSSFSTGILILFCFFLTFDNKKIVTKDLFRWRFNIENIVSFKTEKDYNLWLLLLFVSILLVIFSIMGDLLFSYVKRKFNIKDFSNFLRSHGGFLDRVDSLLVTSLTFFVYTLVAIGIHSFVMFNSPKW